MTEEQRKHWLDVGVYTYAGAYRDYFLSLPDGVAELGRLVCGQVLHRVTLREGNLGANADLRYGDMTLFPWHRMRCEDDMLVTAAAMTAELFRLDGRGFVPGRRVEDKIIVSCRYVSVLMSAILKAKGVPCRSRSGFAPYFGEGRSDDHWINQYWSGEKNGWVTFDADGFFDADVIGFDQYDMPESRFDWAADTWLKLRNDPSDGERFVYAGGLTSLKAAIRAVFYDFHSLMNNEISFKFQPAYVDDKFERLTEAELCEIDGLCRLMQDPDGNFDKLREIWETNRKFRILNSPLVGDWDNNINING